MAFRSFAAPRRAQRKNETPKEEKYHMKIVVIGGGSTYTPELIDGFIARAGVLGLQEIWLVDPNQERLAVVGAFAQRMAAFANAPFKVELTGDRRRAIDGADFVITQLRVGGQAARHGDELLGRRNHLVGQETTGVGGFAKALRTVPVVLDIARDMRELAPQATLVNFTNPAGIVTEALTRHGGVPVVGLCNNATEEVLKVYTEHLRHDEDEIHFPPLLIDTLHAIPSSYLEYFYLKSQVVAHQASGVPTRAEVVMDVERRLMERYSDTHLCEKPPELMERGGAYYSTAAAALIESLWSDDGAIHVVNTRNNAAIPNLPADVVVETPCRVGKGGPAPLPLAPLEPQFHGLTSAVKSYELLTIQAALHGDEEAAKLALLANPLGPDATTVEGVWEDIKRTNAGMLSQFKM